MTTPTTRVRLHGGRNTHAAQPDGSTAIFTTCGHITCPEDHWLPADEPVTCPACKRAIAKETGR
ncbi:hypothetical protein [Streptomyces sp. CS081A]|uniref:hypothetical protein n=1 Tax=Streptomyces sp. CS081A TaxID=2162709 RepID=UPI000D511BEA|nr:hypothetical protein [Streptomyces sp. CS081A]PVC73502.1 hypothetical protein DBP18_14240 [Streptomyces sp. CS081A]